MIRHITVLLFVLQIVFMTGCKRGREEPVETTICAIAANPRAFDGRVVRVMAMLQSDGLEHSSLIDHSCRSTTLAIMGGPSDDAAHRALTSAVFSGRSGTFDKEIRGVFVGRFGWRQSKTPSRQIWLVTASDVIVTPRRE